MSENNIKKLLRGLVSPVQTLEDQLQLLFTERSVNTAIGEQLDVLGRVVGQDRGGMVDDDYRRLIRARISVNRSKGTIADVLTVASLVVDNNGAYLQVDNQGTAAFVLRIEDVITDWTVAELTIRMLRETVSAGVRIILEFSESLETGMFHFDTYTPGGSTGKGWGSTLDASVGGKLASALE